MAMKTNFPTVNSCQFIHKTWGGVQVVIAISGKLYCNVGFDHNNVFFWLSPLKIQVSISEKLQPTVSY